MTDKNEILVAALYKFVEIDDLLSLQSNLYEICKKNNIMGTILIANEGINGTISGKTNEINQTISLLKSDKRFTNIEIKYSSTDKQPFHRMKVRLKKEIVTIGLPEINPNKKVFSTISLTLVFSIGVDSLFKASVEWMSLSSCGLIISDITSY